MQTRQTHKDISVNFKVEDNLPTQVMTFQKRSIKILITEKKEKKGNGNIYNQEDAACTEPLKSHGQVTLGGPHNSIYISSHPCRKPELQHETVHYQLWLLTSALLHLEGKQELFKQLFTDSVEIVLELDISIRTY